MRVKIVFFLFFFTAIIARGQETKPVFYNQTEITQVIEDLEEEFDIKISFQANLILNKTFSFSNKEASLKAIIEALEIQTELSLKRISDRYYIIKETNQIDLSLTQNLEEVVLKEYLTSGVKKKQDGSIVVSPKKLGILPGLTEPDVLQSLQLLPGIQSPTETASGLFVRGGTPDQNLILWDGIKMYHSGHFFGMISAFNPYITKDIKMYSNGTRAKYGNRVSSVIDITSSNKIPQKAKGGGGFNLTHADVFANVPIGNKFALIVSARRSYTDLLNTFTFKNISNRVFQNTKISEGNKIFEDDDVTVSKDFFSFSDFTIKMISKPSDKDEIGVSSLFTKNRLDYGFLISEFNERSTDALGIKNNGVSAFWTHKYSDKFSHNIQGYYSNFELDYTGANNYNGEFFTEQIKKNNIDDFGFSIDSNWNINTINNLSIGYQFSSNRVGYTLAYNSTEETNNYNFTNNEVNNIHALYLEYSYKKKDKWLLNLGTRANYVSKIKKFYAEPRLSFMASLNNTLKFKFSLEQLHQTVSQVVEFNTEELGLENFVWLLADDDIIPLLKSTQFSTGLLFNKNGWNVNLDLYLKRIDGLSSSARGFNNLSTPSFESGKSNVFGIDAFLKKKIENYRTWLSYTFLDNKYTFNQINDGTSFPGNFHINHQINWSHSYRWNSFDFSLGWNFRTGTPYTNAKGFSEETTLIEYEKINNERLPNYHRLDFSTTYKFNLNIGAGMEGKIGFSLFNIYNKKNVLSKEFKVRRGNSFDEEEFFLQEVDKISLGITPNLVFRLEF